MLSVDGMQKTLYPHQLEAVLMMEEREADKHIKAHHYEIELRLGIYADISGYGKTVAMLGLILRDRMAWNTMEEHVQSCITNVLGNGCVIKKSIACFRRLATTLVVAPPTILSQWKDELSHTRLRHIIVSTIRLCDQFEPADYDVVVVSPQLFNALIQRFPNIAWKRFVYDDPTHCKIRSMRPIVCGFMWLMSATPEMLLYQQRGSNNFLSSIFCSYMDYNIYKHLIIKNPDEFVKCSYVLPPVQDIIHDCHDSPVWIVRDLISPIVQDMVSAGNIEGAVRAMGGSTTSNLYQLVMHDKEEALRRSRWKLERAERMGETAARIKKLNDKISALDDDISRLRNRLSRVIQDNKCHICFNHYVEPILLTCCQNIFCGACILKWFSTPTNDQAGCPMCRRRLASNQLVYMDDMGVRLDDDRQADHPEKSGESHQVSKVDALRRIIENEGNFIIFSSYDETFNMIRDVLQDVEYTELNGRMESRIRAIREFKEGTKKILFMNSVQHGAGVNLQEATDIVLYHEMPDGMKRQIIGRALRIGRTTPLRIHHLKCTVREQPDDS